MTCQQAPDETYERFWQTLEDRFRIPWCSGNGAKKIPPDVVIPVISVPIFLLIATINKYFTVIMFTLLPLYLWLLYRTWKRRRLPNRRTYMFLTWGITSALLMMSTFILVVFLFREILLWEFILVCTLYLSMFYTLYYVKQDPGLVYKNDSIRMHKKTRSMINFQQTIKEQVTIEDDNLELIANDVRVTNPHALTGVLVRDITWVDSRPVIGN